MKKIIIGIFLITLALPGIALSGDDTSIPKSEKTKIQATMKNHIESFSSKGEFPIFDQQAKAVINVKFKGLHSGVVKKGDYFVSCADFVDQSGIEYDIDLLVSLSGKKYKVIESLVHKKNGEKFPYDVRK